MKLSIIAASSLIISLLAGCSPLDANMINSGCYQEGQTLPNIPDGPYCLPEQHCSMPCIRQAPPSYIYNVPKVNNRYLPE